MAVFGFENIFDEGAADGIGQRETGEGGAGLVHADGSAGGVKHGNEGGNGVEGSGDKKSLSGESALGAHAGALGLLLGADAVVEFDAGEGLAAEDFEEGEMLRSESVGLLGEDGECADELAVGVDEERAGIGAAEPCARNGDACGRKVSVGGGVGNQQGLADLKHALAAGGPAWLLQAFETELGLEPETILVDRTQIRVFGVTEYSGQLDDLVHLGVRIALKDIQIRTHRRSLEVSGTSTLLDVHISPTPSSSIEDVDSIGSATKRAEKGRGSYDLSN